MNTQISNVHPCTNDVLCGRGGCGGKTFEHIGNKRFRALVSENKKDFALSDSKEKKREIAMDIIRTIKYSSPSGGFLQFNKQSMQWEQINDSKALMKTLQALRENQRYFKQTIKMFLP